VYVEKPICHTIREGRAMVQAARASGKVVQVGTHRRVSPHNIEGRDFIRSGKLGKLGMVRAFVHYGGGPEKPRRNTDPPKELDWDMWCGPAPLRPFNGDPQNPGPGVSIPVDSASTSTMPTGPWETGAFTGWTRSSGSPASAGPGTSSPQEDAPSVARPC